MHYHKFLDPEEIIPISRSSTEAFKTGSWSRSKPVFVEKISPCRAACPTANNIATAMFRAAEGDYDGALAAFLEESPLPGVCGRVCNHTCQSRCNRNDHDNSVNIRALERAISDLGSAKPEPLTDAGKGFPVAVVGSGPAGLAAAYHLARMGHPVTLIEARERLGGLLAWGIPGYRLPEEVLKRDLERILTLDIKVVTNQSVDLAGVEKLLGFHRAVLLATGTWAPTPMGFPGEELEGIWPGLDFLLDDAMQAQVKGQRVIVIGGGNTAIDAARVALRRGAAKVSVLYRPDLEALPAWDDEVCEAAEEGVYRTPAHPMEFVAGEGRVIVVRCKAIVQDATIASSCVTGAPEFESNGEFPCDVVITAIGQSLGTSSLYSGLDLERGRIAADRQGRTGRTGLYVAGDAGPAQATVVDAMASGKRAAATIHLDLTGRSSDVDSALLAGNASFSISALFRPETERDFGAIAEVNRYSFLTATATPPQSAPNLDAASRVSGFQEVVSGLDLRATEAEAGRCFFCGTCTGCDRCATFCPEVAMGRLAGRTGYACDPDFCKGCGACAAACVRGILKMGDE
jgi:NADPH-dependent glutamate synthase beta subunit-like oxidoreductase